MEGTLPGQTKGLYPLGCLAFKHIPGKIRGKLDVHATPSVYLGLDPNCRAYLLGSLFRLDVSTSVEATFVENVFPFRKIKHREAPAALLWGADNNLLEGDPRLGMFDVTPDSTGMTKVLDREALATLGALPPEEDSKTELRRSTRLSNARFRVPESSSSNDTEHILVALTETQLQDITPRHAEQAVNSSAAEQWLAAMNREKQCHIKNGTFGAEWDGEGPCPKAIPAGWVFKIKHRGNPIEEKDLEAKQFKARVVIRGQYMREGLDFNDTFAPVAKPATIRAVLALATKHDCQLKAGDIETAFLTADMDCEVWVRMPAYWGSGTDMITDEKRELRPRRLLKGVPGIPQGSRLFYDTFADHLKGMGWFPSMADDCLFLNADLVEFCAVVLWVDDFIFLHQKNTTWQDFIAKLCTRFTVPTGVLSSFLGMQITYHKNHMQITQASAIKNLLERAEMQDCNATQSSWCRVHKTRPCLDCPCQLCRFLDQA